MIIRLHDEIALLYYFYYINTYSIANAICDLFMFKAPK